MDTFQFNSKWFVRIGYLVLLIFLILSIVFFKERVIHTDNAFQHFLMLKFGFPQIMENRYGMYLLKLPSYIFLYLGASIKTSIIIFSMSYILLYSLAYFILVRFAKNEVFALLIVLCLTAMMSHDFYWCASEQITGYVMTLLLFGMLNPSSVKKYWWVFGLGIIALTNFFHPLLILLCGFLLSYLILEHKQLKNLKYYFILGFVVLSQFIKKLWFTGPYDTNRIEKFSANIQEYLFSFWEIPSFKEFFQIAWHHYYFFYILLAISTALLIRSKSFLKLLLLFTGIFLHLLIITLNEPSLSVGYYSESNFLVFGIYTSIPMLFELWKLKKENLLLFFLVIIFSMSVIRIYNYHKKYSPRMAYIESLVHHMDHPKSYLSWDETEQKLLTMEWAMPFESALISGLHSKQINKTLFIYKDSIKQSEVLSDPNIFLNIFKHDSLSDFHQRWINLPIEVYQSYNSIH